MSLSYALAGGLARRLSRRGGLLEVYREIYYTAGFEEPFDVYLSKCIVAYAFSTPSLFALAFFMHFMLLRYPLHFSILLSLIVAIIYTLAFAAFTLYYPVYRRYSRGSRIDSRLPYTIAHFAALAASGMGLEGLVERLVEVEESKEVEREFALFLTDVKLLGIDVLTALERRAARSPSIVLSLFFSGLRDVYVTAGNPYEYSAFTARRLLELKRYELRRILNTVSVLSEVYVTAMVAAPLMFIVMLVIIGMLGGTLAGLTPQLAMFLILSVWTPASAAAILVILDAVLSKV